MRSNRKHTTNELERYIHLYLEEGKGFKELQEEHGLSLGESTFNTRNNAGIEQAVFFSIADHHVRQPFLRQHLIIRSL